MLELDYSRFKLLTSSFCLVSSKSWDLTCQEWMIKRKPSAVTSPHNMRRSGNARAQNMHNTWIPTQLYSINNSEQVVRIMNRNWLAVTCCRRCRCHRQCRCSFSNSCTKQANDLVRQAPVETLGALLRHLRPERPVNMFASSILKQKDPRIHHTSWRFCACKRRLPISLRCSRFSASNCWHAFSYKNEWNENEHNTSDSHQEQGQNKTVTPGNAYWTITASK